MNPITTSTPDPLFQVYCRFIELALAARRAREAADKVAAEAGEEAETDETKRKKAPK